MSTGEATAVATDVSGEAATTATTTKKKGGDKAKPSNPKEAKGATKPAKSAKVAAKAAPVKTTAPAKTTPAPAKTKATATKASYRAAAELLKMASDGTRITVLMILMDGEQNVTELCEQLNNSQPAVSHHLALLRHGGLVLPTRAGKNNIYSLTDKGQALAASIAKVCEVGA